MASRQWSLGNCGVGFAPVRPGGEQALIELMEGVEDIPGTVLAEGITWGWESFPDYLDVLSKRRWMIDVGTHVPHAAVRAYVMGDRANDDRVTGRRPGADDRDRPRRNHGRGARRLDVAHPGASHLDRRYRSRHLRQPDE